MIATIPTAQDACAGLTGSLDIVVTGSSPGVSLLTEGPVPYWAPDFPIADLQWNVTGTTLNHHQNAVHASGCDGSYVVVASNADWSVTLDIRLADGTRPAVFVTRGDGAQWHHFAGSGMGVRHIAGTTVLNAGWYHLQFRANDPWAAEPVAFQVQVDQSRYPGTAPGADDPTAALDGLSVATYERAQQTRVGRMLSCVGDQQAPSGDLSVDRTYLGTFPAIDAGVFSIPITSSEWPNGLGPARYSCF